MLAVAFLRGINVGGRNVVKNDTLHRSFLELGFNQVSVVKQSGNVVFETDSEDLAQIAKKIQLKLRNLLGRDVGVFIRTMSHIEEVVQSSPLEYAKHREAGFLVTFLSFEPSNLEVPTRIPNSTADIVAKRGMEVFSVTRGYGDGGKPNSYIERKLKTQATTRNWDLICELVKYR
jgi:uncharacterized protein (DUF1697 family)